MKEFENQYNFSKTEWESCLKVLATLKENPLNNPDNKTFGALITKIHKNAKKELKLIPIETDEVSIETKKIVKRKKRREIHKEFDLGLVKASHIVHNAPKVLLSGLFRGFSFRVVKTFKQLSHSVLLKLY